MPFMPHLVCDDSDTCADDGPFYAAPIDQNFACNAPDRSTDDSALQS